jgi:pimeloyl-ACP methyl ester carboxylesterase
VIPAVRTLQVGELRMAVSDCGAGPAVVFCHGFPDLARSWRRQQEAVAAAGFRAIAPDQRGYGGTDRPAAVDAYTIQHLTGDLVALLDVLDVERAVFVGHDWGGLVVWQMPLLHPGRTAGVVGVNTPYLPRPPAPPVSLMRALFGPEHYIVHFQQPGVGDAGLARDVRRTFTQLMKSGVPFAEVEARVARDGIRNLVDVVWGEDTPGTPILDAAELDAYVETFTRTGFTGGINWYRNIDRNWETTAHLPSRIEVPSLMVIAEWDPVLRPELAVPMQTLVSDLETVTIPRCGHWTPQERPDELNRILVDWLTRRFGGEGRP